MNRVFSMKRVNLSRSEVHVQKTILISLAVLGVVVTLTANAQTRNWRDLAEYNLYTEIVKPDATPAARLQNLEKWKSGYPQSEYADVRLKIYSFDTAGEILKSQPNDLLSLTEIVDHGLQLLPEQPNASLSAENKNNLDTIQKTSRYILENLDMVPWATDPSALEAARAAAEDLSLNAKLTAWWRASQGASQFRADQAHFVFG
jgi:hypothetical protein